MHEFWAGGAPGLWASLGVDLKKRADEKMRATTRMIIARWSTRARE
jgi:hypothetical protein